jgi:preprotein translocase subunit SecA
MTATERRRSYASDVTYVTAKEAGFDYLRDQLVMDAREVVHRPFHAALVDEADSILIDEARVPLVIAGQVRRETAALRPLAALVASFTPGIEFDSDEYGRNVELTEAGIERAERALGCGSLHDEANYRLLTELNCALHAQALLRRDVDYIVRNGRIEIVDELTGRVVGDRHWPDGLQAALEAKEGLARRSDGEILGSITLQHYLELYPHLCGMTGTARTAAAELHAMYGLGVTIVPTHRPMIRVDHPDVVFSHRDAKQQALVEEIAKTHASGRPVLVGTLTVEESEALARRLLAANVPCQVLNAKNDEREAAIVAQAGAPAAVTISTNMAGRGTDIKLGGQRELDRAQVVALGGLYVIGTSRHESLRVDLQLRGRAGRQGDPGESRVFVSLDDDLLVRYGLRQLVPARLIEARTDEPRNHPILRREIARAQRIIEGQNFDMRKTLARYADVVEHQRRLLLERRDKVLAGHEGLQVWSQRPDLRAALAATAGEPAVQRAEQAVTLFHIDRAWRDHLALIADLREGIHLVSLAGKDPLTHFTTTIIGAFDGIDAVIDQAVIEDLPRITARDGRLELEAAGIRGPSSTWTYLVNDDPFQNQIGRMLTGPGRSTIAIYSGLFLMPLLLLWAAADRFGRRRRR